MKRIVLEESDISPVDLERYLAGKAREHRVRPSALLGHSDLLANVMRRVIDDDFLESQVRRDVLQRIASMVDAVEREPPGDDWASPSEAEPDLGRQRALLLGVLAATTAIVGSLVAVIPTVGKGSGGDAYIAALGASLALIAMALAFVRLRENDDSEPSRESALQREARLERLVQRILKKADLKTIEAPDRGLDFVVEREGASIGLELKAWQRPVSRPVLGRVFKSAETAGRRMGVDEVLLVIPSRGLIKANGLGSDFVRVVEMDELEQALRSRLR